jgi:hypothetical protein
MYVSGEYRLNIMEEEVGYDPLRPTVNKETIYHCRAEGIFDAALGGTNVQGISRPASSVIFMTLIE